MVYLLKFRQPVGSGRKFVSYYLGYSADRRFQERLAEHRAGAGAKLVAAAVARGIDFDVVRTWPKATRTVRLSSRRSRRTSPQTPA
jgi:predicted GIY-YIG superfamily endonuclease